MRARARIDESGVDADPVLVALHRTFEDVAHAELPADVSGVDVLALEAEGGIAGDHEAIVDTRQIGRQILRDAVREIILVRVVREIGEGKDYDRKTRGRSGRGHGSRCAVGASKIARARRDEDERRDPPPASTARGRFSLERPA